MSSRLLVASARVIGAYSAITSSKIPFRRIAAMLGYTTQRALDSKLEDLLDRSTASLRRQPIERAKIIPLVVERLTKPDHFQESKVSRREISRRGSAAWLVNGDSGKPTYTTKKTGQFQPRFHREGDI